MADVLPDIRARIQRMKLQLEQERLTPATKHPTRGIGGTSASGLRLAVTQEAAQSDLFISVKLKDRDGNPAGEAFDATAIIVDGATQLDKCTPQVASGADIVIGKLNGTWYIINPTFTTVGAICS